MENSKYLILFILLISGCKSPKNDNKLFFDISVVTVNDTTEFNKRKNNTDLSVPFKIGYDTASRVFLAKINIKNLTSQTIRIVTRHKVLAVAYNFYGMGMKKESIITSHYYENQDIDPNNILYTHIVYPANSDSVFYKTPILLNKNKPKEQKWLVTKFIKNKDKKIVFDSYRLK